MVMTLQQHLAPVVMGRAGPRAGKVGPAVLALVGAILRRKDTVAKIFGATLSSGFGPLPTHYGLCRSGFLQPCPRRAEGVSIDASCCFGEATCVGSTGPVGISHRR
jgi:hypothetical protein